MTIKLSYYTVTIYFVLICSIIAAITGFKHKWKFNALKFFYLYPLASFIQTALAYTFNYLHVKPTLFDTINNFVENIFLLMEFLIINHFYRKVLNSFKLKQVLIINALLYFAILILYWNDHFLSFPIHLFVIQACFILIPTFAYLLELFKNPTTSNLPGEFSFWITVGIILYFSCTLPIFLTMGFIYDDDGYIVEKDLYSINNICYGILFLFITKAYLCPPRSVS